MSYGLGVLADKGTEEQFGPQLTTVLDTVKAMHTNTKEDDAKDNCVACVVRIVEKYGNKLPEDV